MGIETYNDLMNWSYDDEYSSPNGVLRPRSNYQTHNQSPYAEVKLYESGINTKDLPHDKVDTVYLDRLREWDSEKYGKASQAIGTNNLNRANGKTIKEIETFLSVYMGKPCKLLSAGENLGYNGYYYTYLTYQELD